MASAGVFDACLAVHGQDNAEELLRCVSAHLEEAYGQTNKNINANLLIISGALVFFMQAGFAMLCAGSVRKKNAQVSSPKTKSQWNWWTAPTTVPLKH
jgi:Amt family ammonium transporter